MNLMEGPEWSEQGIMQRAGRYPLRVEVPVLRAIDLLVPGVSAVTRYVRYYALYAALGAHAAEHDLDGVASLRLLRRSEVILAGVSRLYDDPDAWPGMAHAVDDVRHSLDGDVLHIGAAARMDGDQRYSPRRSGFWEQYRGPCAVLGTTVSEDDGPRPGRHACPPEVTALFAPLWHAADADVLDGARLEALAPLAMQAAEYPEARWMRELFTATSNGRHDPEEWGPDDHRRRATFRILGRSVHLHGGDATFGWEESVKSAVAFGHEAETDPVLRRVDNLLGWRGLLLRNYSVSAWRRLWAALVRSIGSADGEADRSLDELRAWLADPMPAASLRACLAELPDTMADGQPAPAERRLLEAPDWRDPLVNVKLLLVGGLRSGELKGEARTTFLGTQHDILNPLWVARLIDDFADRPMRDLAVRLVDDMLAQARRVALAKTRPDANGRMKVFSRVHERGGRYYKTGDEGDGDIGTRLHQAGDFSEQLGLLEYDADAETASLTPLGAELLEVAQ
ncbi:hypothetical protein [Actinomadura decatromicini]|uniref:Uncharacterized protein n=1 Tax=Actinomadura decatromicini TaxID=2604572 RepID=A0A5D3F949_9ACTN|nr:hypothetical protein [Actinomadura decatromicini]TYK44602.1 hypothetical protein FXF68_34720 [Actinomadura decatromicini]